MPVLNAARAHHFLARLEALPPDRKPGWGKMNPPQLFGHLCLVVQYTLGSGDEMPFRGNFKSRNLFRPLILNGIVPIPKNIKVPRPAGVAMPAALPEASFQDLAACMESFLARQSNGDLPRRTHPFFGSLTPREWSKFHVVHFTHHLKQFGA